MKNIILTLAALSALSTASFAERSWDLRDSPEAQGSFSTPADRAGTAEPTYSAAPLAAVDSIVEQQPNDIYDAHGFRR